MTKLNSLEMAKCPCCGSNEHLYLEQCTDPNWFYVVCRNRPCSYHASSCPGKELAIEEWNESLTWKEEKD